MEKDKLDKYLDSHPEIGGIVLILTFTVFYAFHVYFVGGIK